MKPLATALDGTEQLAQTRRAAAKASKGISDDAIYDAIVQRLAALDVRGDVLDFGAGVGLLTHHLARTDRFRSVSGADLLARPGELPESIGWHSQDLNSPLEIPSSSLDAIVACEVIEHLENPRAVVRDWFRMLRRGGLAILTTPNNESLRAVIALLVRGHFVSFGDTCYPAHITALLRKDVQRIFSEAGFDEIGFDHVARGGIPLIPWVTWQDVSGGLLRGARFSETLVAWGRKPGR
ncbi:MAG TPA: methyltransferase domain-containing protein [Anaeromyxobacteraceae bacterium]|nr:methyltransferase domain-containing protein [Anaeromyxobacteraceae bacterium]